MNESPTPETDALVKNDCGGSGYINNLAKLAEKLERERDEARDERDKLQVMRAEVVAANKGAKINATILKSLKRELDEAREELSRLSKAFVETNRK